MKRYLDAARLYALVNGPQGPFLAIEKENFQVVRRDIQAGKARKAIQDGIAKSTLVRVKEVLEAQGVPRPQATPDTKGPNAGMATSGGAKR